MSVETQETVKAERADDPGKRNLPPLGRDPSFWGMTATQFLGAYNDNLFKQLMLLLAVSVGTTAATAEDKQELPTFLFSLAFVLFSGYAGYLSDRFSKRPIIVLAKFAEIAVMGLGMVAFLAFEYTGYAGLLVVLFLMGTQSAFFGPGKYGILPEMLRERDLPLANASMVLMTFMAIILGTVSAGLLCELLVEREAQLTHTSPYDKERLDDLGLEQVKRIIREEEPPSMQPAMTAHRLWIGSAVCIGIAVAGTLTSLLIRRVPPARPGLPFEPSAVAVPPDSRRFLREDAAMSMAILASSVFWLVSVVAAQAVNSLGLIQLRVGDLRTSAMTAVIAVGIGIGAVVAGVVSRGRADNRVVHVGTWGLVLFLLVISISLPDGRHLLGYGGSLIVLVILGAAAGMFAIPVQVFIQARPPDGMKGRMIAVMNQANFLAMMLGAPVYWAFKWVVTEFDWPRSYVFAMLAALMLPVALFYRLPAEVHSQGDVTDSAGLDAE